MTSKLYIADISPPDRHTPMISFSGVSRASFPAGGVLPPSPSPGRSLGGEGGGAEACATTAPAEVRLCVVAWRCAEEEAAEATRADVPPCAVVMRGRQHPCSGHSSIHSASHSPATMPAAAAEAARKRPRAADSGTPPSSADCGKTSAASTGPPDFRPNTWC
ncbi:unnamed protein product [Closterium sp. NIES-54]